jgi:hypothetical protein
MNPQELSDLYRLGVATAKNFEGLDPQQAFAIKSQAGYVHRASKALHPMVEKAIDKDERRITYAANAEIVDRVGDVVIQKGWDTEDFKAHGSVFLWNHIATELPIGQVSDLRLGKVQHGGKAVPALVGDVEYLSAELNGAAEVVWRMAAGIGTPGGRPLLRATSVGMQGLSYRMPTEEDKETYGKNAGFIYETQSLLEWSQATVPANPAAIQTGTKGSKAATTRAERELDAALEHMVEEGGLERSAVAEFKQHMGLSPEDAERIVREKVRSFVDFGAVVKDAMADGLDLDEARDAARSLMEDKAHAAAVEEAPGDDLAPDADLEELPEEPAEDPQPEADEQEPEPTAEAEAEDAQAVEAMIAVSEAVGDPGPAPDLKRLTDLVERMEAAAHRVEKALDSARARSISERDAHGPPRESRSIDTPQAFAGLELKRAEAVLNRVLG